MRMQPTKEGYNGWSWWFSFGLYFQSLLEVTDLSRGMCVCVWNVSTDVKLVPIGLFFFFGFTMVIKLCYTGCCRGVEQAISQASGLWTGHWGRRAGALGEHVGTHRCGAAAGARAAYWWMLPALGVNPGDPPETSWNWPFIVDFPIKNGDFT